MPAGTVVTGSPGLLARVARVGWFGVVAMVVLVAVLVTVLRLATYFAPEFRGQLESVLEEATGQSVHVDAFRLRLRGLDPQVELDGVLIGADDQGAGFSLERLDLVLDVAGSLRQGEPVVRELILERPDLSLQRDLGGEFRLVGMHPGEGLEAILEGPLDELLLRRMTIRVQDGRVRYEDLTRGEIHALQGVDLRLVENADGGRQLAGHAPLPDSLGDELAFVVEWGEAGVPLHEDVIRFYARTRGLRPDLVERLAAPPGEQPILNAGGNLEVWGRLQGGIPGLSRQREDGRQSLDLTVRGDSGELHLPRLFRGPIPFDEVAAEARWRSDGRDWQVDVDEVSIRNEDGRVKGLVRVAHRQDRPLFVDVRASAQGESGNAARTGRYLPVSIMPPNLVFWLDEAIRDGTATRAEVIYHGHAADFPFDGGEGVFRVTADTRDVTLAYWPDWQPLTGVEGTLDFRGRGMRINASDGEIGGARLQEAEARIDRFGESPLQISGSVRGEGAALLDFLAGMPLSPETVADVVRGFRLEGEHGVDLALTIPFHGLPVLVDGALRLTDARLSYPARDLAVEGLAGVVRFGNLGLEADNLHGRLGGTGVQLALDTRGTGERSRIRLSAELADLPAAVIRQQFPALDFLHGSGDVAVQLDFPGFAGEPGELPVELRVESDLQGIGSRLPMPAAKRPEETWPFALEVALGERPGNLRFRAGGAISGVLGWSEELQPQRLGLALNGNAGLPASPGIAITGRPETVDLDGWLRRGLERAGDEAIEALPVRRLDLDIGRLLVRGMVLDDVSVYGDGDEEGWQLAMGGPSVDGSLHWRAGETPVLEGRFRHLVVPLDSAVAVPATDDPVTAGGAPLHWPEVRLDVDRLTAGQLELGSLRLRTVRGIDSYRLTELSLEAPDLRFDAEGIWEDDGDGETTHLAVRGRSDHVERALSRLGYADAIAGATGRLRAELHWPGSPAEFDLTRLRGELVVNVRDGQLKPVDPGAGRMLGLLSVATIPRRLTLNFADLVEEGFTFDRIRGEFVLSEGEANPRELWLEGPSARIEAEGPINLVDRSYDQTVTVIPRTSAALPLIGGLIAGPPGAAALFLAQTVFSGPVDRVTRFRYRLTGPWHAPEVERIPRSPAATGGGLPDLQAGDPADPAFGGP